MSSMCPREDLTPDVCSGEGGGGSPDYSSVKVFRKCGLSPIFSVKQK